ncbi:40565_t:CDS:2 [Gigaspora margarita]|uniref:40565_t:CDS:1 n=1 Tax=Gigaspora margarita TaxID=4874 RepID=A0ABN7VPL9_GIGMA|nr:40565_t:CDS:2 [Gigaspora margarita]
MKNGFDNNCTAKIKLYIKKYTVIQNDKLNINNNDDYIDDIPLYQICFRKYFEKLVESKKSTSHAAQLYCKALTKDIKNNEQAESTSRLFGPLLFGLQCKSIEAVRKILLLNELIQMKPFNKYSISTQCKHILGLEKQVLEFVEEEKENFFHLNDNIILKQAKFEVNGCMHIINYGKIDKKSIELQAQAIVKSIDCDRISQEAYRSLARLDELLIRTGAIYDIKQEITNRVNKIIPISLVDIDQPASFEPITEESNITNPITVSNVIASIGKNEQQRITDILNYIIPFYVQKGVLKPENSLYLRILGDGRNVGKKVKHVMITVALLNNLDKLHKPESYYSLVLFPGMENYYSLQNALAPLISDLRFLNECGFYEIGKKH